MKTEYIVIAVVAVIVVLIGFRYFLAHKKATVAKFDKSGIDISKLVQALGGKENIKKVESSMSKVGITLDNPKAIDVDTIKLLGATGIVQNQSKVSIIFGKVSETVAKEIEQNR